MSQPHGWEFPEGLGNRATDTLPRRARTKPQGQVELERRGNQGKVLAHREKR